MDDPIVSLFVAALGGGGFATLVSSWLGFVSNRQIAVNVLNKGAVDAASQPMRDWAMDVIDKYSEVKLPPKARDALKEHPLFAMGSADGASDVRGGGSRRYTPPA
jgi:hypothetical protein